MSTVKITLSAVEKCLDEGMTRTQIAEHFGISMSDCKRLFQNEQLKNRKPKKQPGFEFIDDSEAGQELAQADHDDNHADASHEEQEEEQEQVADQPQY